MGCAGWQKKMVCSNPSSLISVQASGKLLSFYDYNTLALVIGSGNDIAAIQQRGKGYSLYNVSCRFGTK